MARTVRKSGVKEVPLSEIKDDLSRFLREAETQEIVITRHGKPAGVLIGFEFRRGLVRIPSRTRSALLASYRTGAEQPARGTRDQARRPRNEIMAACNADFN